MRAALFLVALVALLPYVLLATAFLLLDHAIAAGGLPRLLSTLISQVFWLVPWGILAFVCASIGVALLGLLPRTRGLGGFMLCLLATASIATLVLKASSPLDADGLIVLLPCIAIAGYGGWITFEEWHAHQSSRGSLEARA